MTVIHLRWRLLLRHTEIMLRLLLVALLCVPRAFANCQNGWTRHGNSCYHFSSGKLGWTAAFMMCKIIGGYLVEVNSNDEKDFLGEKVKLLHVTIQHNLHPTNADGNENCLEIWPSGNWNDDVCTDFERYICEANDDPFGSSAIG